MTCTDLQAQAGEERVGRLFIKETCSGISPDGLEALQLDARYLRKKGQEAVNRDTRQVNATYFESFSRLEMVRVAYPLMSSPGRQQ